MNTRAIRFGAVVLWGIILFLSSREQISAQPTFPDFTVAITPSSQSVAAGQVASFSAVVTTTITGVTVNLTCSGLPAGATCNFSSNPVGAGTHSFTVSTSSSTPSGAAAFSVTGTSGPISHSTTASLTVNGTTASLLVSPNAFSFNATLGSGVPLPQNLNITNGGAGSLSWSAIASVASPSGGGWLQISPTSGTGNGHTAVSVDLTGLSAGNYNGSIQVSASGATGSPQTIPVLLSVSSNGNPILQVNPIGLFFSAGVGIGAPLPQNLNISNGGSGSLSWLAIASVTSPAGGSWLHISPSSGSGNGHTAVSVDLTGLSAGNYSGSIQVSAAGATGSPQTIPVSLSVSSNTPTISLSTTSLGFTGSQGGSNPGSQSVSINNTGGGTLSWSATTSPTGSWLSISSGSGTAPSSIMVSVNTASLTPGNYNGAVSISSSNATNSPQIVNVSLSVTGPNCSYSLNPTSQSFSVAASSGVIGVTTGSGCAWSATSSDSWVTFVSGSGTGSGTVLFNVASNPNSGSRTATIAVQGQVFMIVQAGTGGGCAYSFSPGSASEGAGAVSDSFAVLTSSSCSWTATASDGWIIIGDTGSASGIGSGTIAYHLLPNASPNSRMGVIGVQGAGFLITQAGGYSFSVSASQLNFASVAGQNPASQSLVLSSTGTSSAVPWYANANTSSGGNWLSISPTSGTATSISVLVDTTGLGVGSYSGYLGIYTNDGSNISKTVVVNLVIQSGSIPILSVSPSSLLFSAIAGQTPSTQNVTLSIAGTGSLSFSWSATWSTVSGGNWLSVSPASGTNPNLIVSVNTSGLSTGTYNGSVQFSRTDASASSASLPVSLTIAAPSVGAPSLLSPTSGATGISIPVTFTWTPVSGANSYTLLVYAGPSASSPTVNVNTSATSFTSSALAFGTSYLWSVTANGSSGASGSSTWNFTTSSGSSGKDQILNYSLPSTGACSTSFFISTASLLAGQKEGIYSLIVSVSKGLLVGGFNLGGGFAENGGSPGFGQFKIPIAGPPAPVTIKVDAQAIGVGPARLILTVNKELGNGNRTLIQGTNGIPPLSLTTSNLEPGTYYTVGVSSAAGSPRGAYQMQLIAPSGGFEGGVVAGGYAIQGVTGYGGFCVPSTQTVNVNLQGGGTFGQSGAGNLNLGMQDSAGRVYSAQP